MYIEKELYIAPINNETMENKLFTIIDQLVSNGKIFSANFTKSDGSQRVMNCRVGVQKDLKGLGLQYDRRKARNIIVWDMNAKGYRTIKTDRLKWIRIGGQKFDFNTLQDA